MERILGDLRFALRNLRRSPVFTIVAIASLALGIGANTAIFTLIDQLILRLLPVTHPEQLVMIWTTGPHMGNNRGPRAASYPMYQDFQQKAEAFAYVFARLRTPTAISFDGRTERIEMELVSGNFFQALGVKPVIGRVFSPEEDDRIYKGHPSVVLSHQYWVSRFAANPSVIGQKIVVNNYPMTIVGVSAAGFSGLDPSSSPQIRVPLQMKPLMTPGWDDLGNRRSQWLQVFARLKPGFTMDKAQASLQPLLAQILREELSQPDLRDITDYNRNQFLARKIRMEAASNGYSDLRRSYSTALAVLMCMVGLVLLIACFNVANLLIAQAVARQKEMAMRLAVGASRRRILSQLLIESLVLSSAGAIGGLILSDLIIRALLSFMPSGQTPLLLRPEPDGRILAFTAALAILTALLFGLAPGFQSFQLDLWNVLKDVAGAVSGASGSVKLRKILVTAQVALSFLLLAGAGLFVKTLANLRHTNTGFSKIENLVTFALDPRLNGYSTQRLKELYRHTLEALQGLPGVNSAAYAAEEILAGGEWDSTMGVEGHHPQDGEDMQAFMNAVSPEYFRTMGVPILEGRDFDRRDSGKQAHTAIVNRTFATHFFGGRSPIGRHIGFGTGPKSKLDIEIVGMTEDTLYAGPREGVRRQVFLPFDTGDFPSSASFYLRTSVPSATMFGAARQKVQELDRSVPIFGMRTVENQLDETLGTERLIAALSAAFGVLATLLAAIGLYGVLAFMVARRTKEIGLRMALGAPQGAVVWMVMRETVLLLGVGLAAGIPCVWLLSRYVGSQLFGVKAGDPGTAVAALAILAVVAMGAGLLPARRASGIDPIKALRHE